MNIESSKQDHNESEHEGPINQMQQRTSVNIDGANSRRSTHKSHVSVREEQ